MSHHICLKCNSNSFTVSLKDFEEVKDNKELLEVIRWDARTERYQVEETVAAFKKLQKLRDADIPLAFANLVLCIGDNCVDFFDGQLDDLQYRIEDILLGHVESTEEHLAELQHHRQLILSCSAFSEG